MGTDRVAELENQISELKKQLIIEKEKQAVAEDSGLWEYDVAGLYEREAATKMIEKKLFEAPDEPGALLLVDLNDFKVLNDTYGRVYGDTVLEAASNIISTSFRIKDIVGRIAGDAFFIFCSGIENETAAEKLVNKMLLRFQDFMVERDGNKCGVSAGFELYPRDGETYDQLYHSADIALFEAKKYGKNGFHIYQPGRDYGTCLGETYRKMKEEEKRKLYFLAKQRRPPQADAS